MEKIILQNGYEIPDLCIGTGITSGHRHRDLSIIDISKYSIEQGKNFIRDRKKYKKNAKLPSVIHNAMKHGGCYFDTSRAYGGSEYVLGKSLSKYERDSFYVETKLDNQNQYKNNVRGAFEKSLKELQLEYVDVYLMHWPVAERYIDSWKEMERLYQEGLCKVIGVCNFNIHHLQKLEQYANVMPMINQFECHPRLTQNELRAYCREHRIQTMAYTSTARMDERLKKTVLVQIAKKYHKSMAQIILKWHQQIGNIPIVSSTSEKHIVENIDIYDFRLSDQEVEEISAININSRMRYDPDNCDFKQL